MAYGPITLTLTHVGLLVYVLVSIKYMPTFILYGQRDTERMNRVWLSVILYVVCFSFCCVSQAFYLGFLRKRDLRALHLWAEQPWVEREDAQLHQSGETLFPAPYPICKTTLVTFLKDHLSRTLICSDKEPRGWQMFDHPCSCLIGLTIWGGGAYIK